MYAGVLYSGETPLLLMLQMMFTLYEHSCCCAIYNICYTSRQQSVISGWNRATLWPTLCKGSMMDQQGLNLSLHASIHHPPKIGVGWANWQHGTAVCRLFTYCLHGWVWCTMWLRLQAARTQTPRYVQRIKIKQSKQSTFLCVRAIVHC